MPSLGEVILYMKGDDSQLESSLDGAKGKTNSFASTATNLLGGVVAGAAVAAAGAIVGIGTAAFNVSSDTATAAADIAASLGIPIEEAERFAEVARRVYGNNFADSVGDAAIAVEGLAKQLGLTADDPALQTMTENAFRLRDVFGVDVNESIDAVKTLMENFGVSGDEAFDLIARGHQVGLDRSGDFLDTIGEYSVQFKEGGASVEEYFSLLQSGLQGGMLGTDKAADLFKEFRVRIQDGSESTRDALESIGINADEMAEKLGNGSMTAFEAFEIVDKALRKTTDSNVQFTAGVGLLGSQFEDLGASAALGMETMSDSFYDIGGAIENLDAKYATFGSAVDGIWRRLIVSISPYTDKLLELVNDAMPAVMGAFDQFDATVGPAMEATGNTINTVVNFVKDLFSGLRTSVDDNATGPLAYWKTWVDTNLPLVQTLIQNVLGTIQQLWQIFGPAIELIASTSFNNILLLIDTVMRTIGDLITLTLQVLTGDWEGAWGTMEGIVTRIWDTIRTVVGNQLGLLKDLILQIDWAELGRNIIQGIANGISSAASTIANAARRAAEDALKAAKNFLGIRSPSTKAEKEIGEPFGEGIGKGIEGKIQGLAGNVSLSLGGLMSSIQQPAASATNGMTLNIYLSGDNATYESGRAVSRGVLDELRKRGR